MRAKLEEARYFRARMDQTVDHRTAFTYELSAFLTATRTVLQYLREECVKAGNKGWYDGKMGDQTLGFFKSARDMNIHRRPVEPQQNVTLTFEEHVVVGEGFSITTTDEQGRAVQHEEVEANSPVPVPTKVERTVEFFFEGWPGQEDVPSLCDKYLRTLESTLDEWDRLTVAQGQR